ncbi:MAG: prepilin-type N-terminal cleavage/methylation domain-containing protein [Gemmatimonadaceae bacterium]
MRRKTEVRRAGFTLVEVMVALLISAVVLLGARVLLEQLGENASRTVAAAAYADEEANGEQVLRDLAGRLDVGTDAATQFSGEANAARFGSWCDTPSGWEERCAVALVVRDDRSRSRLVATFAPGDSITLLTRAQPIELRYLNDPRAGGRWFVSWGAGITAPLAVAVISGSDTMIVRIGERG